MLLAFEDSSHVLSDPYPVAPQSACLTIVREWYPFGWVGK